MTAWLMRAGVWLLALTTIFGASSPPNGQHETTLACLRCGWRAPTGPVIDVANVEELERAVAAIRPGGTVRLARGKYALRRMLDLSTRSVTLRGRLGDSSEVVLHGGGMTGDHVGVALSVSAPDVTIADLTVRDVGYHAIQVRGERGASRFTLHNVVLQDTGQQLLKLSVSKAPIYADDGVVACSSFRYSRSAPSDYTNGVDLLAAKGWVIRDNRFDRIRGPESGGWAAGPAVLAWAASEDTIVERNLIVDSFRGIALGLATGLSDASRHGARKYDHRGGVVRNNVIVNLGDWADEAIEANAAENVRIEHNTVLVEGRETPWSIGLRFPATSALVRNNLTNRQVLQRQGGRGVLEGNVAGASRGWFVDPARADLRLAENGRAAIDAGVPIADLLQDFDRGPRNLGKRPDAGAFEVTPRPVGRR